MIFAPALSTRLAPSAPDARLAGGGRWLIAGVVVAAAAAGFGATSSHAASAALSDAGPELARLLRAMAVLKAVLAAGGVAATIWRLGEPAPWRHLGFYAAGCAAMAEGPGLIWNLAHVVTGAVLLHGGLLATAISLWLDPATAARLNAALAGRRAPA